MAPDRADGFDALAEVSEHLAVLLQAGLPPARAWRALAAFLPHPLVQALAEPPAEAPEIASRLFDAVQVAAPGEQDAARALAAVWRVASETGAPLGPTLATLGDALRDLAQAARDVDTALAGPVATGRLMLALPPLGLAAALLLGVDAVGALTRSPLGIAGGVGGAALLVAGARWTGRLVRAARAAGEPPGIALELLAIALAGGAGPERSLARVAAAASETGIGVDGADLERRLAFAVAAGVPAGGLLRAEAAAARRRARSAAQRRAAQLGTRLLIPLGVCVLPAFVALGVAPVVIAILSSTALSW